MSARLADPRLVPLIGEFLNTYLPVVRRRDEDTVRSYRTSVNLFLDYLRQERGVALAAITPADLCPESLTGFMDWLRETRGNAAPTINHRLSDVRGLCHYAESRGVLDRLAYELVREVSAVPDDRATEFTWLETDEVCAVLEAVASNEKGLRDNFMLSLLYESGGRIGEVLALRVSDLAPAKGGTVDVHFYGKGKKHRRTPLSQEIWDRFREYSDEYLPGAAPSDLVFYVEQHGKRHEMSHDNVEKMLKKCEGALRSGGLPELQHLHTHLFRRSRAMHLYQSGVPLPTISEWLGHSRIETTKFYAKVTELMKRDALGKLAESDHAVFKSDVAFKYADDDETLRRLYGIR